jgi:NAD(P)-dependent dehydrogenase (short-subunit alcohol dehydrogenase family)
MSGKRQADKQFSIASFLDLSGRVALITGGAQGMGRAIAKTLSEAGAISIVGDIQPHLPEEELMNVKEIDFDVTDEEIVRKRIHEITTDFGKIDILVNNAGVIYKEFVEDLDMARWQKVIDVNLTGPTICTKAVIPAMKKNNWGRIINISSTAAYLASPRYSAYSASKAGLSQLTRVWAQEVVSFNITVNALCPSYVRTPMMEQTITITQNERKGSREEAIAFLVDPVPQKRLIEPEEIAYWTLILSSEFAKGITGANISISGGFLMH